MKQDTKKNLKARIVELELLLERANADIEIFRNDLQDTRRAHGQLARSVKSALGLKCWPKFPKGKTFQEMVGKLVADRINKQ